MAENLRRSVGNVTYYVMHGKTFARAKVAHVKKSDSPQQLRQRVIFGLLIQLSKVLLKTTRVSFPQRVNGRSSSNEFVHLNRNSVTVNDKFEATINLEELKVSNGELEMCIRDSIWPRCARCLGNYETKRAFYHTLIKRNQPCAWQTKQISFPLHHSRWKRSYPV